MAHNPTYSVASKNLALDAALDVCNGGYMDFYAAPQPASPDVAVSDSFKAVRLALSPTAFAPAVGGTKVANAISSAVITQTLDVRWYRLYKSDGVTAVHDGTVGTIDYSCDATVATTFFQAGVTCTCLALIISIP